MKRIGLIAMVPLLLVAISASAGTLPPFITHTVTYTGSYTVGVGTMPTVDVYKITYTSIDLDDPDPPLSVLILEIGANAGDPNYATYLPAPDPNLTFDDPFQAAWRTGGKTPVTHLTPTREDADTHLMPPDDSKLYETDSSFLPTGIATWPVYVVLPTEENDESVYSAGDDDYKAGVGNLRVAVAIPEESRAPTIDVAMVGCIRGTTVYCYSYVQTADQYSSNTVERFLINEIIPEPVSLSLLGVGGAALIRKRRT